MVRKVEHVTAARAKKPREAEKGEAKILRRAEAIVPRLEAEIVALVPFAGVIASAQRAADACPKRGTASDRLAHLIRNCPDGVNPFAAPAFFSLLFRVWTDLKLDVYGRDPKPSFVARFSTAPVRFSSASSRREFDEILAAILEAVPRGRGRAPVGWFELHQRRRIEEKAGRLVPSLERVLDQVGRLRGYRTVELLEQAIRERARPPAAHPREVAEVLWDCRTERGTQPVLKAARRLAKVLLDLADAQIVI